jgi:hypothetical protein
MGSYVEGSSARDFPLIPDAWSPDYLESNVNNINGLKFYHEIRWNVKFLTRFVMVVPGVASRRQNRRPCTTWRTLEGRDAPAAGPLWQP